MLGLNLHRLQSWLVCNRLSQQPKVPKNRSALEVQGDLGFASPFSFANLLCELLPEDNLATVTEDQRGSGQTQKGRQSLVTSAHKVHTPVLLPAFLGRFQAVRIQFSPPGGKHNPILSNTQPD